MSELLEAEKMIDLTMQKYIIALNNLLKIQEELEITEILFKKGISSKDILKQAYMLRTASDNEVSECHKKWQELNEKVKELRRKETSKLVKKL